MGQIWSVIMLLTGVIACLPVDRPQRAKPCADGACQSYDVEEASALTGEVKKQQGRIEELRQQISNINTLPASAAKDLKSELDAAEAEADALIKQLNSMSGSKAELEKVKNRIAELETIVNQLRQKLQDQTNIENKSGGDQGDGKQGDGKQGDGDQGDGKQGDGKQGSMVSIPTPYVYFTESNGYRVGFRLHPWDKAYATSMMAQITYGDVTFNVNEGYDIELELPVTLRYTLQGKEYCWHARLLEKDLINRITSDDFTIDKKDIKPTSLSKLQEMQKDGGGC